MTELAATLHATVSEVTDKQTGSTGVVLTTPEGLRLGYFPEADALRLAAGHLRFNWDHPPVPDVTRDGVALTDAEQHTSLSITRGKVVLVVEQQPNGQASEPSAAADAASPARQEQKRKTQEVRGVVSQAVVFRQKRNDPSKLVGEFHIIQTEPPPPAHAPDLKVTVFEARGGLKHLREAVDQQQLQPGMMVTVKGYQDQDFLKKNKDGTSQLLRQFNAVVVSPAEPHAKD